MAENNDNLMAMLAHGLGIVTGFLPIAALILYFLKREDGSDYLKRHVAQALGFQLTLTIAYAVLTLSVFGIVFLFWLPYLIGLIFTIMAILAAAKGNEYSYPKWTVIPFPFAKNA